MWLYILSSFSREQSHSNKCKQQGPYVPLYFPPVPLLSRGFHKHIIANVHTALTLCTPPPLSHSLPVSESLLSRLGHFLHNAGATGSICSNGPAFWKCECWVSPNGKHTVSPESFFEGLPRSWVLALRPKGNYERSGLNVQPKRRKKRNKRKGRKSWFVECSFGEYLLERFKHVSILNCFTLNTNQSYQTIQKLWATSCIHRSLHTLRHVLPIVNLLYHPLNINHCFSLFLSPFSHFFFPGCLPSDQPLHMGGQMER